MKMSPFSSENVIETGKMSPSFNEMSPSSSDNVTICKVIPQTNAPELTDEELALPLEPFGITQGRFFRYNKRTVPPL
jgi:hypothetical protein